MISKSDKRLKAYYKEIKRELSCPREEKKKLLEMISGSVEAYIEEHPEADFDALLENFGSAKDVAEAYRAEENPEVTSARLKKKKAVVLTVAGVLLAALIAFAVYAFVQVYHARFFSNEEPVYYYQSDIHYA